MLFIIENLKKSRPQIPVFVKYNKTLNFCKH
uniref:Uncharacterized protein n=1 Tax=Human betaherpesvirus 6 TaxID=10368 RepID=A0A5P9VJJ1_9BETA|nr:hypothetical protein [Human betaherpesvirus 6]QFX63820.1 hypothetical protein [Human betaherpesvirus 6]